MVEWSHSSRIIDTKINMQSTLAVFTDILTAYSCNTLHYLEMACDLLERLTLSLAIVTSS